MPTRDTKQQVSYLPINKAYNWGQLDMYLMCLSSLNNSFFVLVTFPTKWVGGQGISVCKTSLVLLITKLKCLGPKCMSTAKLRNYLASMAPASSADIKNGAFTKTSLQSVDSLVWKKIMKIIIYTQYIFNAKLNLHHRHGMIFKCRNSIFFIQVSCGYYTRRAKKNTEAAPWTTRQARQHWWRRTSSSVSVC